MLPPHWAMGLWFICRTQADAREFMDDCHRFRSLGIPCDAIGLEPGNPIYYWNLARALFRRRYYEEAITWWGKQKALDSSDAKPYLFSARSFMKLKRFDDAVREFRDLIRLNPDDINYRIELTRTLLVAGRLTEAIDEYHRIVENDPRFSKTTLDAIRQYQRRGNYPEATRILNEVLSSARSS